MFTASILSWALDTCSSNLSSRSLVLGMARARTHKDTLRTLSALATVVDVKAQPMQGIRMGCSKHWWGFYTNSYTKLARVGVLHLHRRVRVINVHSDTCFSREYCTTHAARVRNSPRPVQRHMPSKSPLIIKRAWTLHTTPYPIPVSALPV